MSSKRANIIDANNDKKKQHLRRKVSLVISAETDMKLSTLAAYRGIDRSALADEILSGALRGVVISFRGNLAETGTAAIPGKTAEATI